MAGALLALAASMAAGAFAYGAAARSLELGEHVAHAEAVLDAVDATVGAVEAAARTIGTDAPAAGGEEARPIATRTLHRLRVLAHHDAEQRAAADTLDTAIRAALAYCEEIQRRRAGDVSPPELADRLAELGRRVDEIAGLATAIRHVEHRRLASRVDAANARARGTRALLAVVVVLALAGLGATVALARRETDGDHVAPDRVREALGFPPALAATHASLPSVSGALHAIDHHLRALAATDVDPGNDETRRALDAIHGNARQVEREIDDVVRGATPARATDRG